MVDMGKSSSTTELCVFFNFEAYAFLRNRSVMLFSAMGLFDAMDK